MKTIETVPAGLLAERIVDSGLGHAGVAEVPSFLPDTIAGRDLVQTRRLLQTGALGHPKVSKP